MILREKEDYKKMAKTRLFNFAPPYTNQNYLNELGRCGLFHDMEIRCDDRTVFEGHRAILGKRSKVIQENSSHNSGEILSLDMTGYPKSTVINLLSLMYRGETWLTRKEEFLELEDLCYALGMLFEKEELSINTEEKTILLTPGPVDAHASLAKRDRREETHPVHYCDFCPQIFYLNTTYRQHLQSYHGVDFNTNGMGKHSERGEDDEDEDEECETDDDPDFENERESAGPSKKNKKVRANPDVDLKCLQCDFACTTVSLFREHLSLKHYKLELENKFVFGKECADCGYNGSSVARHVGSVHRKVDRVMNQEERELLLRAEQEGPLQKDRPRKKLKKLAKKSQPKCGKATNKEQKKSCERGRKKKKQKMATAADLKGSLSDEEVEVEALDHEKYLFGLSGFQCPICKVDFSSRSSLRKHIVTHYRHEIESSFQLNGPKCPICNYEGKYKGTVIEHVALKHKKIEKYVPTFVFNELFQKQQKN